MKYKISLSTYHPEIVKAFSALGYKKSQYIEQSLLHFIGTKKGKNTLKLMLKNTTKTAHTSEKWERTSIEQTTVDKEGTGLISVDSFLE